MKKRVILFLAEGFEEVEALTPIDYLRRADIEVCAAAIGENRAVQGSHGICVNADALLAELAGAGRLAAADWDGVVIPGGMPGSSNIAASELANKLIMDFAAAGKIIGAICAAPAVVLSPLGLLDCRRFTCYPGLETSVSGANWSEGRVVADGNFITSRGAGTAGEWSFSLIRAIAGQAQAEELAGRVLLRVA